MFDLYSIRQKTSEQRLNASSLQHFELHDVDFSFKIIGIKSFYISTDCIFFVTKSIAVHIHIFGLRHAQNETEPKKIDNQLQKKTTEQNQ